MIEVKGLGRNFRQREALKDISFTVEPGEILGLIGPNGSGKSTAIRCITGILQPNAGEVKIAGHDVFKDPISAKRSLAYLPDNPALFETLTCWEHVELAARIYGVRDFQKKANALFTEFELDEKKRSLASELSRGMRQRLSLICALVHEPKVFVLDEPMLGLDPKGIRLINETLVREAKQGAAVVISSHLLALLEEVATKVLILRGGKTLIYGSISEVRKQIQDKTERLSLEELFFYATEKPGKA